MTLKNHVKSYNIKNKTNYSEMEFFEEYKGKKNLTLAIISEMLCTTSLVVSNRLKELGFKIIQNGGRVRNEERDEEIIKVKKEQNITNKEIAKKFGIAIPTVGKILKENGIDVVKDRIGNSIENRFLRLDKDELQKMTAFEVSKVLNGSSSYINVVAKKHDIKLVDNRKKLREENKKHLW